MVLFSQSVPLATWISPFRNASDSVGLDQLGFIPEPALGVSPWRILNGSPSSLLVTHPRQEMGLCVCVCVYKGDKQCSAFVHSTDPKD